LGQIYSALVAVPGMSSVQRKDIVAGNADDPLLYYQTLGLRI